MDDLRMARGVAGEGAGAPAGEAAETGAHDARDPGQERIWLDAILATVADGIVCTDDAGYIELYNPAAQKIFGWSPAEVLGRSVSMLMPEPHASQHDHYMRRYLRTGRQRVIGVGRETVGLRRDGSTFPMSLSMTEGVAGGRRIFTAVIRDVTEVRRARDELERHRQRLEHIVQQRTRALSEANARLESLAREDALTGLANRRRLDETLDAELRRASRAGGTLSVLMCDVDHFKAYNDRYGHDAGDRCLRSVADALACHARRAADLTARWGGEEFAVVLPDTPGEVAAVLAEQRREAIWDLAIEHEDSPFGRVTITIGVASTRGKRGSGSRPALMKRADEALYLAKRAGRNAVGCERPD